MWHSVQIVSHRRLTPHWPVSQIGAPLLLVNSGTSDDVTNLCRFNTTALQPKRNGSDIHTQRCVRDIMLTYECVQGVRAELQRSVEGLRSNACCACAIGTRLLNVRAGGIDSTSFDCCSREAHVSMCPDACRPPFIFKAHKVTTSSVTGIKFNVLLQLKMSQKRLTDIFWQAHTHFRDSAGEC